MLTCRPCPDGQQDWLLAIHQCEHCKAECACLPPCQSNIHTETYKMLAAIFAMDMPAIQRHTSAVVAPCSPTHSALRADDHAESMFASLFVRQVDDHVRSLVLLFDQLSKLFVTLYKVTKVHLAYKSSTELHPATTDLSTCGCISFHSKKPTSLCQEHFRTLYIVTRQWASSCHWSENHHRNVWACVIVRCALNLARQ